MFPALVEPGAGVNQGSGGTGLMEGMEETSRITQGRASCFACDKKQHLAQDITVLPYSGQKESWKKYRSNLPSPSPILQKRGLESRKLEGHVQVRRDRAEVSVSQTTCDKEQLLFFKNVLSIAH